MEVYSQHPDKPYYIKTDYNSFDKQKIYHWLAEESYWSKGMNFDLIDKSFRNSLCFGLFHEDGEQVAISRLITDRATFAYLCDVFVDQRHRGKGLGYWFIKELLAHPDLQGLRRMMLATSDMQVLYEKFGFSLIKDNKILMEKLGKNLF